MFALNKSALKWVEVRENIFSNPFPKFCADTMSGCSYTFLTWSRRCHFIASLVRAEIMTVSKHRSVTAGEGISSRLQLAS